MRARRDRRADRAAQPDGHRAEGAGSLKRDLPEVVVANLGGGRSGSEGLRGHRGGGESAERREEAQAIPAARDRCQAVPADRDRYDSAPTAACSMLPWPFDETGTASSGSNPLAEFRRRSSSPSTSPNSRWRHAA